MEKSQNQHNTKEDPKQDKGKDGEKGHKQYGSSKPAASSSLI